MENEGTDDPLAGAIEALAEGFVLFDSDDRLVTANRRYREINAGAAHAMEPGAARGAILDAMVAAGEIEAIGHWPETYAREQAEGRANAARKSDLKHRDGRVFTSSRSPTPDGGCAILWSEVSERRQADAHALAVLDDMVQALDEGVMLWDSELRYVTSNQAHRDIVGEAAMPIPGETAYDGTLRNARSGLWPLPEGVTPEALAAQYEQLVRSHAKDVETVLADGRVFNVNANPTRLGGVAVSFRDVTAERTADEMPTAVATYDADLRLVGSNRTHDLMFGADPANRPLGVPFGRIASNMVARGTIRAPDGVDAKGYARHLAGLIRAHASGIELATGDGRTLLASASALPGGSHLVTLHDVTERARANAVLDEFIQSVGMGLLLFDADWRLVKANRYYEDLVRPHAGPLLPGETALQITERLKAGGFYALPPGPELDAFVAGLFAQAETPTDAPVEIPMADGRRIHARRHATPAGGYLLSFEDVTARLEAEERARAVLVETVEALDEGVALCDADFRYVLGNARWYDLFFREVAPPSPGEPAASFVRRLLEGGHYDTEGLPEDIDAAVEAVMEMAYESARARGMRQGPQRFADGRAVTGSVLPTDQGGYLLVFQEITAQLEADERARGALLEIVEALDEGVALYDSEFRFVLGNRRFHDLFFREVAPATPGEAAAEAVRRLVEAGHYDIEGLPEDVDAAVEVILNYRYGDRTRAMRFSDGRSIVGHVLPTDQGGTLLVIEEITDRLAMEDELSRQREIAHQSEKMSAMGELLAGVAHELNNPLSVVAGYARMLEEDVTGEAREMAARIGTAAERCARIVRMFLAMARQRPMRSERVGVDRIVDVALDVGGYGLRSAGVELRREIAPGLPPVEVDPDQIAQVLSNLLVNAEHALAGRPAPRVTLRARAEGDTVVIEVADNGPGVPQAARARIFEPFFTTKDVGAGTGIGLAFAHRIAASHDGSLSLAPGGSGATFRLTLPAAAEAPAAEASAPAPEGGDARVLVVDDEADVADMLARMLGRAGFAAEAAYGGSAALDRLGAASFDAVISDMKMPGMSGAQFHAALVTSDPNLAARTIFMTGDALSGWVQDFLAASGRPHIEKPVDPDVLSSLLTSLLEDGRRM